MESSDVPTVLPRELRLGVPPKMPQSRSYLFRQQSVTAQYNPTETITINIPRLQRSYLRKDSYLRFRLNGTFKPTAGISANGVVLNQTLNFDTPGAYGLFDRIEVFDYLGSTVLESIQGINACAALLLDLGLKEYISSTNGNTLAGLGRDFSYGGTPSYRPGAANLPLRKNAILTNAGFTNAATTGATIAAGTANQTIPFSKEFAIPLPSFLGFLSEKMVPLHNGFTIVLTLASRRVPFIFSTPDDAQVVVPSTSPVIYTTTTPVYTYVNNFINPVNTEPPDANLSWFVSDVYMNCQILELGPVAESMILSSTQGAPLVVATKSFRNYVQVVKGASWAGSSIPSTTAKTALTAPAYTAGKFNFTVAQPKTATPVVLEITTTAASGATAADIKYDYALNAEKINQVFQTAGLQIYAIPTDNGITYTSTNMAGFTITAGTLTANQLGIAASPAASAPDNPTTPVSTGQSEFILNMNLNVVSLTNILWTMRSSSQLDSLLYLCLGNRTRNFLHRWYFQYGSTALPQSNGIECFGSYIPNAISTGLTTNGRYALLSAGGAESFQELMKARPTYLPANKFDDGTYYRDFAFDKSLDPRSNGDGIVTLNLAGITPSMNSAYGVGRFAGGLNLQLAQNKDQQIISGLNTNGMNTSIRGVFHPLYTDFMDTVQVDAWAEFDAFINISPGIATTVSF